MPPVRLQLEEAAALFVAGRLLCRYSDENNPWVVRALEKLASALPPSVAEHVHRCAQAPHRPGSRAYSEIFGAVTRAWARRRKIRIWYRAIDSANYHDYVVAPYFIEPSAVGLAAYVIGHASYFDAVRTFKMERIKRVEELPDEFEPPADFDDPAWLETAWNVMAGGEIDHVELRFAPSVARRVRESVWHPSQQLEECPDGSLRCRFTLREPREMIPWIRGWGGDVEVLAPA